MVSSYLMCVFAICASLSSVQGFFLYSSSSSATKKVGDGRGSGPPVQPPTHPWAGYSLRDPGYSWAPAPGYPPYSYDSPVTVTLPVAVPIQAQVPGGGSATLQGTLHNVQLVPCLCPITKEPEPAPPKPQNNPAPQQPPQATTSS